jgi:hypothetical protein
MNDSQSVPGPQFEAKEVDSLIANFGVQLSPEKREELHQHLDAQKEQFISHELDLEKDHDREGRGGR